MTFFRFIPISVLFLFAGCGVSSWHAKHDWNAADYFADAKVISLCQAIESENIEQVRKHVANGADINAKGLDGMTPLLWAWPLKNLELFEGILDLGADPDVIVGSHFGTNVIFPGDSVTALAARKTRYEFLKAVLDHGGNPDQIDGRHKLPLLHLVIWGRAESRELVKLLVSKDADLNLQDQDGRTPLMSAVVFLDFDSALILLERGADPFIRSSQLLNVVDYMVMAEQQHAKVWDDESRKSFHDLEQTLLKKGISVEQARKNHLRWNAWAKGNFREHYTETLGYRERQERAESETSNQEQIQRLDRE